ncbi:MAG: DNA polymerase/3'-5' exonuclease PolX [Moorellales bacterium]
MISNLEIAWIFNEIADLLELKGDNPFKARAYRQGARALEQLTESVETLAAVGQLQGIPGIGPALAKKIGEIIETGRCSLHERLRQEIPPGLVTMLALPGLGPKSVRLIHERLGITTLEELEEAARKRRLRQLPGMGPKTEWNILQGVRLLRASEGRVPLGIAWSLAEAWLADLRSLPGVERAEMAGELRRAHEMVEGITLVVGAREPAAVLRALRHHPQWRQTYREGPNYLCGAGRLRVTVEIYVCPPAHFGRFLLYYTGSASHFRALLEQCPSPERRHLLGWGWLFPEAEPPAEPLPGSGSTLTPLEEEEIYAALGLAFVPPELREGEGEIEAARQGHLPGLIRVEDIRGDLHVHTNWSDGRHDPEEMALAARARGYAYLGIADHSRSLTVARGLTSERLLAQREYIQELNRRHSGFRLLAGVEVDILVDGSLDYPDEILAQMDLVIASIHTGFKQEQEQIMARLRAALDNPHVDIIAHPTGRLLGRRSPYSVDLDRLLEMAAEKGKALEINATGDRLDLGAEAARKAAALGVPLVINTDAHDAAHLSTIRLGVAVARRAGLGPEQVLNTLPWEELRARLVGRSGKT